MIYFDSAYIARCYLPEPGHAEVLALARRARRVASAAHARVEVAASFHRKVREGALTPLEFELLWLQLEQDVADRIWNFIPVSDALIAAAQQAFRSLAPGIFLRSADCLHLCAAVSGGFTEIHSNDRHLLAAAPLFGLAPVNVIPPPV